MNTANIERRARSMSLFERRQFLADHGWTMLKSDLWNSPAWPDDDIRYTTAAAIRYALFVDAQEEGAYIVQSRLTG